MTRIGNTALCPLVAACYPRGATCRSALNSNNTAYQYLLPVGHGAGPLEESPSTGRLESASC